MDDRQTDARTGRKREEEAGEGETRKKERLRARVKKKRRIRYPGSETPVMPDIGREIHRGQRGSESKIQELG